MGFDATGVDFAGNLIDIAKNNNPNSNYIISDICDYKPKEKFDGIFSKDALFHLPDRDLKKVLKNINKMLNEKGKLCIIMDIPKQAGEQILIEPLDSRFKLYYNYLLPQKVEKLLTRAGFKIDDMNINNDSEYVYASGVMVFFASK